MDRHCWTVLLVIVSAVAFHENAAASDKIQEKRLSFDQHSKCTYSYELAVHTARGSKSTATDGSQIHAMVSYEEKTADNSVKLDQHFKFFGERISRHSFSPTS